MVGGERKKKIEMGKRIKEWLGRQMVTKGEGWSGRDISGSIAGVVQVIDI